ncbi:hypothetical protein ACM0P6_03020 [Komagataeibacter sucrofermentans]|uniref:Uncharacterized protein n=1 Tax=Komagataeibacter sucrofermentans TaxID=1053551 RepID=A0A318R2H0_9PROT|nr:hypothetical protein [Komagataeibacter sucrofermentans]PYD79953.1 hypothetical protein CFR77_05430 [Komagataeibacter sucrofermentans]GBQ52173.1 hypothetical protein AA15973_2679 [Komagataeibacter sucrofermentans DSM 15973]
MTNEMKTETPMYLVPGKVTPEVEHRAANVVFDMYGREILWPVFHAYMTAIASPIQPCADVETVCVSSPTLYDNLEDFDLAQVFPVSLRSANGTDIELVRRADMEAQVAKVTAEKDAQIRHLETFTLPNHMTPDIERALGTICFRAAPYAHAFRKAGAAIPTKAEAEQAFVIFKLLKGVLQHGTFEKAADILWAEAHAAIKKAGKDEA